MPMLYFNRGPVEVRVSIYRRGVDAPIVVSKIDQVSYHSLSSFREHKRKPFDEPDAKEKQPNPK